MKIHEYQARKLFSRFDIPVLPGEIATTAEEAEEITTKFKVPVYVKAQVHVGGRGKAGGIKFAETPEQAKEAAKSILGMDIKGYKVSKVYVVANDPKLIVTSESYLGLILDRGKKAYCFMACAEGGVEIEEVARKTPDKIFKIWIDAAVGMMPFQARKLAKFLYKDPSMVKQASQIAANLFKLFRCLDASLAEINPLVTFKTGAVCALDAKINFDDNALFRHSDITEMYDPEMETDNDRKAKEMNLSFVPMEGNIGCIVNGAGLAMTTMDVIKYYGGEPANFLDVGGSSSPEKVKTAMELVSSDKNVKSILINIFGGITRCDDIAKGLLIALETLKDIPPVIVRLTGTNEKIAREILLQKGFNALSNMEEAAKHAIKVAEGGAL
ncbi:MAG: ADP-forming succinate--CoA ligase subunit beta [Candidatus Coatesbacteria bacterium]|nr:ADP-forming succinate--CoA ligase subunit beta [Candidatus Coatesbacteria bacterium]